MSERLISVLSKTQSSPEGPHTHTHTQTHRHTHCTCLCSGGCSASEGAVQQLVSTSRTGSCHQPGSGLMYEQLQGGREGCRRGGRERGGGRDIWREGEREMGGDMEGGGGIQIEREGGREGKRERWRERGRDGGRGRKVDREGEREGENRGGQKEAEDMMSHTGFNFEALRGKQLNTSVCVCVCVRCVCAHPSQSLLGGELTAQAEQLAV